MKCDSCLQVVRRIAENRLDFFCVVTYSRIRSNAYKSGKGGLDFGFVTTGSAWQ